MNVEKVYQAVLDELKRYVAARTTEKRDRDGAKYTTGMTVVSSEDARLDEMARLCVEAMQRVDDGRARVSLEARALRPGDMFTRYAITADGVAIDEEVTVVKVTGTTTKPRVMYRNESDKYGEIALEGYYLLSVYRPTAVDMMRELDDADHA